MHRRPHHAGGATGGLQFSGDNMIRLHLFYTSRCALIQDGGERGGAYTSVCALATLRTVSAEMNRGKCYENRTDGLSDGIPARGSLADRMVRFLSFASFRPQAVPLRVRFYSGSR
mgnify:CR=1 FL=1